MSASWRAVGITYIQYSNICARVLREGLKATVRADALKRNETNVKFTPWVNGKPVRKDV